MRLSPLLVLSLAPITVLALADPQNDPLDVLNNVEALANLKQFVSAASSLSSLTDEKDGSSPLEKLRAQPASSGESPDLSNGVEALSQIKNVASLASTLFSHVDGNGLEDEEQRSANGNGQLNKPADTPEPLDILKGIEALQQFASLASGIGSLMDVNDLAKTIPSEAPQAPAPSKPPSSSHPPAAKETSPKKASNELPKQPKAQPVDIFARLEAMQKFSNLAKKLTTLTNVTDPSSITERIQRLLSDPEVTSTMQYIFENASKVFTPEVLNALKAFLLTSPLVPDEYRPLASAVAGSLGAVFSAEFAAHFRLAKETLDRVGFDLIPVLESAWNAVQWVMDTFDAGYIQRLNKEVRLWHKALTSPEMAEYLGFMTGPETLDGITGCVTRMKKALTAERIHRLNGVFDRQGLFDLEDDEYQAFGEVLGKKLKVQFTTAEGISDVQQYLDTFDKLLQSQALEEVVQSMQMRAAVLTPYMAEDVHAFFKQLSTVTDTAPVITAIIQGTVELIRPVLEAESRPNLVLTWQFWADINLMLDRLWSVPSASLVNVQKFLETIVKLLQPERVQVLRLLIADVTGSFSAPGFLGALPLNLPGNASAMVMGTGFGMLETVDTTPVLAPVVLEDVLRVLNGVDAFLVPGEVEKTREAVHALTEAGLFIAQVMQVFETEDTAGESDGKSHEEL
ncbi:hypothetical protein BDW62DRAFT_204216 [Aspergillus aurantiobrunneus]